MRNCCELLDPKFPMGDKAPKIEFAVAFCSSLGFEIKLRQEVSKANGENAHKMYERKEENRKSRSKECRGAQKKIAPS